MSSLGVKAARKIKRIGKNAVQFRFTSTFEYIDVHCNGTWRPDNLRIVWLRSHRRVQSIDVKWEPTEDRGPNGAEGRATFNPTLSVSLLVTLYRGTNETEFDEKTYKYYIENDGPAGKKILASFTCDMAEYAGIPTTRHKLDMTFKTVSQKVNKAVLGITLESEYIKQGNSSDVDMQSTFSAISTGNSSIAEDEEDGGGGETSPHSGSKSPSAPRLSKVAEEDEMPINAVVTLGTGEMLKRGTLPYSPPSKPPRTGSIKIKKNVNIENEHSDTETQLETSPLVNGDPSPPDDDVTETQSSPAASLSTMPVENGGLLPANPSPPAEAPAIVFTNSLGDLITGSTSMAGPSPAEDEALTATHEVSLLTTEQPSADDREQYPQILAQQTDEDTSVASSDSTKADSYSNVKVEIPNSIVHEIPNSNTPEVAAGAKVEGSDIRAQVQVEEKAVVGNGKEYHSDGGSGKEDVPSPESNGGYSVAPLSLGSKQLSMEQVSLEPLANGFASNHEDSLVISAGSNFSSANDFLFETAEMLAEIHKEGDGHETSPSPSPSSEKEHKTSSTVTSGATAPAAAVGTGAWLGEANFVDCFAEPVSRDKLERADIIGLYFSANWCPPCRRFLPKLIKFYHHLKQHNKSFEILYISSDYSKQDMMKYMQDQQMPWVGLAYDSSVADKLRGAFSVSAIPLFTIITRNGAQIEASAKKPVEAASNGAAVLKLYNKWHEKLEEEGGVSNNVGEVAVAVESKEKRGLFKKVKDAIGTKSKEDRNEADGMSPLPSRSESQESHTDSPHAEDKREQHAPRQIVEGRQRVKSKLKVTLTEEMLEAKEERIRHLEEVNAALKQTNDDLNEELAELRKQFSDASSKLQQLEVSSRQLEEERRELMANLNIRGWLLKRGAKGPTANVWRRRYFRCDQGSKIYYYKSASEGTPQGMVDLDKVVSVQEVSPAQQDKNHATFLVQCDGRTYQLQAIDEATMRKIINLPKRLL